ncbi:hypothetical protein JOE52_004121 [Bradyrhizobium canariense]|nr:hypothetical protein Bra1253DRAFT_03690 [Bradyrhizobium sp. WSM1253]MBM7485139.1 hypothetical protein [Bradyrhizobium canariense]MCS3762352.1 hypothetical protein [Bradyrhizobium centrosematis]MCS3775021.1 hypothetical protein [Bradyrhizobium centrosematis]OSI31149.1 hypothetical protein BST65_06065 [Bradyrhizobium canariense]
MARSEPGHSGNSDVRFKRRLRDPGPFRWPATPPSPDGKLSTSRGTAGSALSTLDTESQP